MRSQPRDVGLGKSHRARAPEWRVRFYLGHRLPGGFWAGVSTYARRPHRAVRQARKCNRWHRLRRVHRARGGARARASRTGTSASRSCVLTAIAVGVTVHRRHVQRERAAGCAGNAAPASGRGAAPGGAAPRSTPALTCPRTRSRSAHSSISRRTARARRTLSTTAGRPTRSCLKRVTSTPTVVPMPDTSAARSGDRPDRVDIRRRMAPRISILAAFDGAHAVDDARGRRGRLDGESPRGSSDPGRRSAVFLTAIEVEGFRGIGPPSTLRIDPGPGLDPGRWAQRLRQVVILRSARDGAARHQPAVGAARQGVARRVAEPASPAHARRRDVRRRLDASRPLEVARVWKDGDGVDGSTLLSTANPRHPTPSGGRSRSRVIPPLLSHNELEHALDREQSKLYDALAGHPRTRRSCGRPGGPARSATRP